MIENLKNRMRLAADLHDWVELNGCEVVAIEFATYNDEQLELQINLGKDHANANGLNRLSDEANETAALLILNADPTLKLRRSSGLIYLDGERDGLTFELYFGSGSCKRVQVGTRKVMVPDPSAPLVEIEEPVFETVCE
jgi:hypothetical protein